MKKADFFGYVQSRVTFRGLSGLCFVFLAKGTLKMSKVIVAVGLRHAQRKLVMLSTITICHRKHPVSRSCIIIIV